MITLTFVRSENSDSPRVEKTKVVKNPSQIRRYGKCRAIAIMDFSEYEGKIPGDIVHLAGTVILPKDLHLEIGGQKVWG